MLGRRALTPVRCVLAIRLSDGTTFADPAVDLKASDLEAYEESNFSDMSHITLRDGYEPTFITFRQLTTKQKDYSYGLSGRAQYNFHCRCSITSLDNFMIYNQDGSTAPAPAPQLKNTPPFGAIATEKWISDLNLPNEVLAAFNYIITKISEAKDPL